MPAAAGCCGANLQEKEVDDNRNTLHNLASLLLTNKTIRRMQQGSLICLFFKN
jgi:hypothetical protein